MISLDLTKSLEVRIAGDQPIYKNCCKNPFVLIHQKLIHPDLQKE